MFRRRTLSLAKGTASGLEHPRLSPGWIREAVRAGRQAFEREMARDRPDREAEFLRFWREQAAVEGRADPPPGTASAERVS